MKRLALLFASAALAAGAPAAAPVAQGPRDLGQGLTYYRVRALPADLPSVAPGRAGPCVLDLRFTRADEPSAAALKAWLRFNATPRTPVFVLENAGTAPAALAAVPAGAPGVLVLAPESARLGPDVAVAVAPEADRRAYDAADAGAPLDSLLHDYPDKPRVDEAYLDKAHVPDSEAPDTVDDKPPPPMPLIDAVLQRAVQLHRGLLALKKL